MAVTAKQEGPILVVTIDRPDNANAIDLETAQELASTFAAMEVDSSIRVAVLTGAGERVFCAGMDLAAVERGEADAINAVAGGFAGLVKREMAKPVVAAVNGAAIGGGFEIVLACDLVVISATARFALPEVTRGLFPASGGAVRLPVRLPLALAMEHLLLGEPIGAERARELGLANRVAEPGEVLSTAIELAERLAASPAEAVQATKRVARTALTGSEAEAWHLNDELASRISGSKVESG